MHRKAVRFSHENRRQPQKNGKDGGKWVNHLGNDGDNQELFSGNHGRSPVMTHFTPMMLVDGDFQVG